MSENHVQYYVADPLDTYLPHVQKIEKEEVHVVDFDKHLRFLSKSDSLGHQPSAQEIERQRAASQGICEIDGGECD